MISTEAWYVKALLTDDLATLKVRATRGDADAYLQLVKLTDRTRGFPSHGWVDLPKAAWGRLPYEIQPKVEVYTQGLVYTGGNAITFGAPPSWILHMGSERKVVLGHRGPYHEEAHPEDFEVTVPLGEALQWWLPQKRFQKGMGHRRWWRESFEDIGDYFRQHLIDTPYGGHDSGMISWTIDVSPADDFLEGPNRDVFGKLMNTP